MESIDIIRAIVHKWTLAYGPPVHLLADNGKQFTALFFRNVCLIMFVNNLFTTTYHPQSNEKAKRFNQMILSAIRHY